MDILSGFRIYLRFGDINLFIRISLSPRHLGTWRSSCVITIRSRLLSTLAGRHAFIRHPSIIRIAPAAVPGPIATVHQFLQAVIGAGVALLPGRICLTLLV